MRFAITGEVDDADDVGRAEQVLSAYGLYNVKSAVEAERLDAAAAPAYNRAALIDALIYHARLSSGGCACGQLALGQSYPGHIADVYERLAAGRS